MKSGIYFCVLLMTSFTCLEALCEKQHKKDKTINRRYRQIYSMGSYEYRFKSNGKFKFVSTHFELGKRTYAGTYNVKNDTINIIFTQSSNNEHYLLSDSCLFNFKMNCIFERIY
jgi:hypothetical protein